MYPSDFWEAPRPVRLTLLAALCHQRTAEIADSLVDLLLVLVLKINTSAVRKVEKELTEDLKMVRGKTALLFRLAETAVGNPDETVRNAVFPVVSEKTLRQLVRESKANETAFQGKVPVVLRESYSSYYRRMLPALLSVLRFRCHNTAFRPVMEARLIKRSLVRPATTTKHPSAASASALARPMPVPPPVMKARVPPSTPVTGPPPSGQPRHPTVGGRSQDRWRSQRPRGERPA
jgi:hypothetical protein